MYEYQAGQDGAWSAVETFEVKKYTQDKPLNILWVSDNQSWTTEEGQLVILLYKISLQKK